MYNSDNSWTPPYYPPNPNPTDPHRHHHPPPPSLASAPPYAPPPQPPQSPSSYPPFPPVPDHGLYSSAPPPHQPSPTPYDPHQSPLTHPNPNPNPNPNLGSGPVSGSYGYDSQNNYNYSPKFEYGSGYFDEGYGGGYGGYNGDNQRLNSGSGLGLESYGKRGESDRYELGYGGGYNGNNQRLNLGSGLESYGKRGDGERYEMGYGGGYNGNNQRLNLGSGSGLESYGKRGESERYEMGYGGGYGPSNSSQRANVGSEMYGNKRGESERHEMGMYKDDGVYAYEGTKESYGARGTGSKGSNWSGLFDDYGRPISFPAASEKKTTSSLKVVKAIPKVETNDDVKSGVQKFKVKLLPESGGSSVMDVLCMVGLDGIRMLDPSTSRTLRIYPLDTVTRCDKIDSSTFAFWSKTSVDVEPRRIRLQSNSYTTNTILDTVTAAMVQFKEMGGSIRPAESYKAPEQPADKKKGFTEWITKLKPVNEEKDHWVPDEVVSKCTGCGSDFSAFNRRHHCRNCGDIFCDKCTQGRTPLNNDDNAPSVRVCDRCMGEVTRRLTKAKEAASRPVALHSHEDLAKKLQEEMEKNLRISGSKSEGSGRKMREVACPTCTVHLQVQVPSSGSETIECGVCQHPFLVSAH